MQWAFVVIVACLLALIFNVPVLAFATLIGWLLVVTARRLAGMWNSQVSGKRRCSHQTAEIGQLVSVIAEVTNVGKFPVPWVLIEDLVPADIAGATGKKIEIHGSRLEVARLRPQQTARLHYQVKCRYRGLYQLGPIVAETGDYYGLHRSYRVHGEPNYVLVYPQVVRIEHYAIESRRPIGEVVMSHRLFEDPTRISGVRPYQEGDPLARVHWRATARTGKLQCKQYQPSSLSGATIVLDFHRQSYDPRHEPYRSELAVTAAASLANALHELGEQFGFVSNGLDAADRIRVHGWQGDARTRQIARAKAASQDRLDRRQPLLVPTRKGADQIQRTLELLARIELNDGLTLAELVAEASQRMPADASVILVLPEPTLESAVILGSLRRQGRAVTAIVNGHDEEHYLRASGVLLNEGIECRWLRDENAISEICRRQKLPR